MTRIVFTVLVFLTAFSTYGQVKNIFQKQLDSARFEPSAVIDPIYGITRYDAFAPSLGGDSVRNCVGYSCQGYAEDFYTSGTLLHKGYYTNGQVNFFKNYYPDGTLERDFKMIDVTRGRLLTYFPNGKLKSSGMYKLGETIKYEEYFENGQLFVVEELDKKLEYHLISKTYFENGLVESDLILVNPKKLEFDKSEFHENGNIKEKGKLFFSKSGLEYIKVGIWEVYSPEGKLQKQITFENGIPIHEKTF